MSGSEARRNFLIRTLIVDDSAFVRKVVREMLLRSPFIDVVGMTHNGEEALEMTARLNPDVVTCDLNMPSMNGVEYVRRQMALRPLPILILSASSAEAALVMDAMDAGAVDFIQKPTSKASHDLLSMRDELIEKVKAAGRAPVRTLPVEAPVAPPRTSELRPRSIDVVVIGVSTGGPQALRYLIPRLPADFPVPILVVLHMPVGYTAVFAEKLAELSKIRVHEAKGAEPFAPGTVTIGQAGRHLVLGRGPTGKPEIQLSSTPLDKPHRPSVDVLFQSAAEMFKSRTLAIVMTGMGDDGKEGAAWVKAQGGTVLTESEESCIIYGMPRSVVEAGLSDRSVALTAMPQTIVNAL